MEITAKVISNLYVSFNNQHTYQELANILQTKSKNSELFDFTNTDDILLILNNIGNNNPDIMTNTLINNTSKFITSLSSIIEVNNIVYDSFDLAKNNSLRLSVGTDQILSSTNIYNILSTTNQLHYRNSDTNTRYLYEDLVADVLASDVDIFEFGHTGDESEEYPKNSNFIHLVKLPGSFDKLEKVKGSNNELLERDDWSSDINTDKLYEVTVGSNIKIISGKAFDGCTQLELVIFPNLLEKIESNAFKNCKNLKGVNIPDIVTEIDNDAFLLSGLKQVSMSHATAYNLNVKFGDDQNFLEKVNIEATDPDNPNNIIFQNQNQNQNLIGFNLEAIFMAKFKMTV